MANYAPEQLTTTFRLLLERAFAGQKVKILVMPFKDNDLTLLLVIENPSIHNIVMKK